MYYSYELFLSLISIVFSFVLLINYIINKNNKGSKEYLGIIINGIIMNILNAINNKMLTFYTEKNLSLIIVSKLTIAFTTSWIVLFTLYIVVSSFENNVKDITKVIKRTKNNLSIMYLVFLIILVFVPINYIEDKFVYIGSNIIGVTYLFSFIVLLMGLISIVINRYNISKKVIISFISFSLLSIMFVMANSYLNLLSIYVLIPTITTSLIFSNNNYDSTNSNTSNSNDIEFIANVSDEINSSLDEIIHYSNDILNDNLNSDSKKDVNNIIATSEDLMQLSNSISDVLKIENDKFELNNQEYNLKEIFDEIVFLASNRINKKDVEFKYEYDDSIPPVLYGDSNRIKQVMLNILTNSIKYTYSGYIKYDIKCKIDNNKCFLNVIIEDTGAGIKEEKIDKLFTKFDDEHTDTNSMGLGIPVTKKIVEFMEGKIQLQSKYGVGSKFEVFFEQEIVPKKLEDIKLEENREEINFVGIDNKILIIDDNEECVEQILQITKDCKVNIETENSGINCIEKILDGNKYELLLIDTDMNGMDGIQTLKNLKNIIGFNTPVIALIESNEKDNYNKYLEEGFIDYLVKPIVKNNLFGLFKKYLKITPSNDTVNEGVSDNMNLSGLELLTSNGVNIDASLELLGDMDMYNDTAKDFLKESETRLKNIEEYKNSGDMPNYAILVHAMKSDSKYLGFTKLAELSYNHEMASKGNDINYVNSNYDELMTEANRIINLLKQYIEN